MVGSQAPADHGFCMMNPACSRATAAQRCEATDQTAVSCCRVANEIGNIEHALANDGHVGKDRVDLIQELDSSSRMTATART